MFSTFPLFKYNLIFLCKKIAVLPRVQLRGEQQEKKSPTGFYFCLSTGIKNILKLFGQKYKYSNFSSPKILGFDHLFKDLNSGMIIWQRQQLLNTNKLATVLPCCS